MRKALFLLLISISIPAISQNAFYDALFVARLDTASLNIVSRSGVVTVAEKLELNHLIDFMNDPFGDVEPLDMQLIKTAIAKYNQSSSPGVRFDLLSLQLKLDQQEANPLAVLPGLLLGKSSLSDSTQSNIIDGIAKYYAEEFRKAQTITYMKAFERTADKIGELRILFPDTYEKLLRADPSRFPDLGSEYKRIFYEDLKNAWPHVMSYIKNYPDDTIADSKLSLFKANIVSKIKQHGYYYPVVVSSELLSRIIQNQHPVEILNYLASQNIPSGVPITEVNEAINQTIKSLNLLQNNLRDTIQSTTNQIKGAWVSLEQLRELNTQRECEYFFGLLYQQDSTLVKAWMADITDVSKQVEFIQSKIYPMLERLESLDNLRKAVSKEDAEQAVLALSSCSLLTK